MLAGLTLPLGFAPGPAHLTAAKAPTTRRFAILAAATAQAEPCQDEEAIRADAEGAFSLLDLNGDGAVSQREFEQLKKKAEAERDAVSSRVSVSP